MKIYLTALMIFLSIVSCTQTDESLYGTDASTLTFQISSKQASVSQDTETIHSLSAYLFREGVLMKEYKNISPDVDKRFSLPVNRESNQKMYFLANATIEASHSLVEESTLESDFLAMTSSSLEPSNDGEEISFLSAAYSIDPQVASASINLLRATARIDVDASSSDLLVVDSIVIGDFPSETYLMGKQGAYPEVASVTKHLKFENPINGLQNDVVRIYESASKATADVYVRYSGIASVMHLDLPTISRNHIYTIKLYKQGASLAGAVNVASWEEGDSVDSSGEIIRVIDSANSHFSEEMQIDYENNIIKIAPQGGDFLLALLGSDDQEIVTDSSRYVGITKEGNNKWSFHIEPLTYKEAGYQLKLRITSESEADKYIQIFVDGPLPLPAELPSVKMAELEWMAFNSYSSSFEQQIFPTLNSTVEEFYQSNWLDVIGMHYQWGRKQTSIPWKTAINSNHIEHRWTKWDVEGSVPCPPGYHIPTIQEFQSLIPNGVELPGSYTTPNSKETITATIEEATSPTFEINGIRGKTRYLKLSSSSGAVLIFPLAGYRGNSKFTENPGLGDKFAYWTDNGILNGMRATRLEYVLGTNASAKILYDSTRFMNAFAAVRCVK